MNKADASRSAQNEIVGSITGQPIAFSRILTAFLGIPLLVPVILSIVLGLRESTKSGDGLKAAGTGFLVSALLAYAMTIVSGIPAWLLCRARRVESVFAFVRIGAWLGLFWALVLTSLGLGQRWNAAAMSLPDRILYDSYAQLLLVVMTFAGGACAWLFWLVTIRSVRGQQILSEQVISRQQPPH